MKTKKIEVEVTEGKTAGLADNGAKGTIPVTERIKTFDDACRELGDSHPLVVQYREIFNCFLDGADKRNSSDLVAYMKLRIICSALNEGWEPKFTEDEFRYHPYFYFKNEGKDKMEKTKQKSGALFGSSAYRGASAGFVAAHASYAPSSTHAYFSSLLFLKKRELAIYCGKQFVDIWIDFVLIREQ